MEHEGEDFEEVHFDDDEEEPMDSDGEDIGDDENRNAQYGDEDEIENGWTKVTSFVYINFSDLHLRSAFESCSSCLGQPVWSLYRYRW